MEKAGDGADREGFQIALEMIEGIRNIKEVNGLHIMPVGREKDIPRLLQEAGLIESLQTGFRTDIPLVLH
jgi:5,10-methylenetetrahydrofolate reductase